MGKTWAELARENENNIYDNLIELHKDALNNPHLDFYLYMDKNGDIWTAEYPQGSNSVPSSVWSGDAVTLIKISEAFSDDLTPCEDDINYNAYLKEEELKEIKKGASDEDISVWEYIGKYKDEKIKEIMEDWKECIVDSRTDNVYYEVVEIIKELETDK